jgi:hypothetical protein
MHRLGFVLLALATACSSPPKPKCLDCGGPMQNPADVAEREERKRLCAAAATFQQQGCSPFHKMDPSLLADCSVVDSLYIATIDECMGLRACEAFQDCAAKIRLEGGTFRGPTRSCNDIAAEAIPAGFDPIELEKSTGHTDKKFSDTVSTPDLPIEVCGMPDQLAYLTRVTCNDGSRPFNNRGDADHARVGNVGRAGRCQRVIDEYAVPCPEATYKVFIDPYRCPRT